MTLVGSPNLKEAILTQDGPDELAPADPLVSEGNKAAILAFDDEVPDPGGPWKPLATHNAWT
jgi:hypothetical protein